MRCPMRCLLAVSLAVLSGWSWAGRTVAMAGDWPTYRHDVARSGITDENLPWPLTTGWVFQPRHAPQPAWGDPKPVPVEEILELRRVHFDDVFQVGRPPAARSTSARRPTTRSTAWTPPPARIRWTQHHRRPGAAGARRWPTAACTSARTTAASYCLNAADGSERLAVPRRAGGPPRAGPRQADLAVAVADRRAGRWRHGLFCARASFRPKACSCTRSMPPTASCSGGTTPRARSRRAASRRKAICWPRRRTLYAPMGRVSPAAFDGRDGRLLYETSFGKNGRRHLCPAGRRPRLHRHRADGGLRSADPRPVRRVPRPQDHRHRRHVLRGDRHANCWPWIAQTQGHRCGRRPVRCADELILAGDVLVAGGAGPGHGRRRRRRRGPLERRRSRARPRAWRWPTAGCWSAPTRA